MFLIQKICSLSGNAITGSSNYLVKCQCQNQFSLNHFLLNEQWHFRIESMALIYIINSNEKKNTLFFTNIFQLFTFDGLIPNNWFAFRIEYRLIFGTQRKNALGTTLAGAVGIDLAKELSTKQVRRRKISNFNPILVSNSEENFLV